MNLLAALAYAGHLKSLTERARAEFLSQDEKIPETLWREMDGVAEKLSEALK